MDIVVSLYAQNEYRTNVTFCTILTSGSSCSLSCSKLGEFLALWSLEASKFSSSSLLEWRLLRLMVKSNTSVSSAFAQPVSPLQSGLIDRSIQQGKGGGMSRARLQEIQSEGGRGNRAERLFGAGHLALFCQTVECKKRHFNETKIIVL